MDRYSAAMQRAIDLARLGAGRTGANPLVGAVIASGEGKILAEGFHAGGDHAEVVALKNYQSHTPSADDVLIVTLEPCAHHGKTPPCVDAIIQSGIKRVIYAVSDPNQIAAGGAAALIRAGISVESGLLEEQARFMNRAWLTRIAISRPFYTWKVAMTLDGKTSAPDGTSKWITSKTSRTKVTQLRRKSDAILVGTSTVLADNPTLIPHDEITDHQPLRVVVGTRSLPPDANVLDNRATTYLHQSRDLATLHAALLERGVTRVLVESGNELGSVLLRAGAIDELIIFIAPSLLGAGQPFFSDDAISTLSQRRHLTLIKHETSGTDVVLHYAVTQEGA